MHNSRQGIHSRYLWSVCVAIAFVTIPAIVNGLADANPAKVMVYASVGEELSAYRVDIERATLTKQATLMMPGFVQEAWASPSTPFIYVAWSNGGGSYANSGVAPHARRWRRGIGRPGCQHDPCSPERAIRVRG